MRYNIFSCLIIILVCGLCACKNKPSPGDKVFVYKGLYSYGPEIKSFKQCPGGHEYWAADSSAQLELQYTQANLTQPDEAVYVEVEGIKIPTAKDGPGSGYDSTLVVKRVIKFSKDIPKGDCN